MNLSCIIQEIHFQSRFDMLIFVCLQQLSLDGVPQTRRKYLIGKWFLYEIGKMVRRQKRRERENRGQAERISRVQIAQYIGKCLGCGGGVVQKYGLFAKAVDESARKAPTLIRMILQDEVRISHENMLRLSGLNKEIISLIQLGVIKNSQDHITYSDLFVKSGMQKAVQPSRPRNLQTQNRRKENTVDVSQPLIRQMPKYDPDAAISSLVLTIPSWSTNIQRMVYENLEYSTEADIFANQMRDVKPLSTFEIFHANVEAGSDKQIIIKDLVNGYRLEITKQPKPGGICAIRALEEMFDKYGYQVLDHVLRLAIATWAFASSCGETLGPAAQFARLCAACI